DGKVTIIGDERFLAPMPSSIALENVRRCGCHVTRHLILCTPSILKAAFDIRRDLYGSVVLSGGTIAFPCIIASMQTEFT
ncbi:hypothetical protein DFH06DRAFT_941599, partial [Mycena polygramma]